MQASLQILRCARKATPPRVGIKHGWNTGFLQYSRFGRSLHSCPPKCSTRRTVRKEWCFLPLSTLNPDALFGLLIMILVDWSDKTCIHFGLQVSQSGASRKFLKASCSQRMSATQLDDCFSVLQNRFGYFAGGKEVWCTRKRQRSSRNKRSRHTSPGRFCQHQCGSTNNFIHTKGSFADGFCSPQSVVVPNILIVRLRYFPEENTCQSS